MSKLYKYTSIGRPLDKDYLTNKLILISSIGLFLLATIWWIFLGHSLIPSCAYGLGMTAGYFLAWALARELDPDHDHAAFVASGLTLTGMFVFYPPDFAGLVWLLLILRVITKTTGLRPKITDSLFISLITGYLICKGEWIYGLFAIFAFTLDSFLNPQFRSQLYFAALNAVLLVFLWIFRGINPYLESLTVPILLVVLSITVFSLPVIALTSRTKSRADSTKKKLNPTRIQAAQVFGLTLGLTVLFLEGDMGFRKLSVLWAVFLGIAFYCLFYRLKRTAFPENRQK